jgi:hypothetical protein
VSVERSIEEQATEVSVNGISGRKPVGTVELSNRPIGPDVLGSSLPTEDAQGWRRVNDVVHRSICALALFVHSRDREDSLLKHFLGKMSVMKRPDWRNAVQRSLT